MVIEKRIEKLNKVRKEGYIAGVLFGKEFGNSSVAIKTKPQEFNDAFAKFGMLKTFNVKLDGKNHEVYFKEITKDILKPAQVVHFSLLKVSKGDKVSASMPIKLIGEQDIEKQGMIVIQSLHEIEVEYPVGSDVTHLEAHVGSMQVGDSVHVADIKLPEGFKLFLHADDVVATIAYPKVHEEPAPTTTEPKPVEPVSPDAQ